MDPYITQPHGQHKIELLEDAEQPGERIYRIQDRHGESAGVNILGEELAALADWWNEESQRSASSARQ